MTKKKKFFIKTSLYLIYMHSEYAYIVEYVGMYAN